MKACPRWRAILVTTSCFAATALCAADALAQDRFWKLLEGPAPQVTRALAGSLTRADRIITTGFRQPAVGSIALYLSLADTDGNLIWGQQVDTPADDFGHGAIETADGDLVSVGYSLQGVAYDGLLTRYSSAGARQWVRAVQGANDDFEYSVAEATDGGLVVTGRSNSNTQNFALTLFKMATDGSIDWSRDLGGTTGDDRGTYVIRTSDGGFAVVGYTQSYPIPFTNQDLLLLKVSAQGNLQWVRTLGFPNLYYITEGRCVVETPDNGLAVVGIACNGPANTDEYLVAKFAGNGGFLWLRLLADIDDDYGHSVTNTDDGRIATSGYSVQPGLQEQGVVAVFDQLGNLSRQVMAGRAQPDVFRSILQPSDGRWVVAGYSDSYTPFEAQLLAAYEPTSYECEGGPGTLPMIAPLPTVMNPAVAYNPVPVPMVILAPPAPVLATAAQTVCDQATSLGRRTLLAGPADVTAPFRISSIAATAAGVACVAGAASNGSGTSDIVLSEFDATGEVSWMRTYEPGDATNLAAVDVAPAGSSWYVTGNTSTAIGGPPESPLVLSVDPNGTPQWSSLIDAGDVRAATGIVGTSDGGCAISGYATGVNMRAFVTKLSDTGAHLWTTLLGSSGEAAQGFAIREAGDGGLVLAGKIGIGGASRMLLAKLDAAGGLIWSRTLIATSPGDEAQRLAITADGSFVLAGRVLGTGFILAQFDSAGSYQWTMVAGGGSLAYAAGVAPVPDGGVLAAAASVLIKTDAAGVFQWAQRILPDDQAGLGTPNPWGGLATNGGRGVLAAAFTSGSPQHLLYARLDRTGRPCNGANVDVTVTYPSPTIDTGNVGVASETPEVSNVTYSVVDLDRSTTVACPSATVDVPIARSPAPSGLRVRVTNPARGTAACVVSVPHPMTLRCAIFDASGHRVGASIALGAFAPGEQVARLPLPTLPAGLYFVVVEGDSRRATAKMAVLR